MSRYEVIEEGVITYVPQFSKDEKHTPDGFYPRRFWDILTFETKAEMLAYLAERDRPAKIAKLAATSIPQLSVEPEPAHVCSDCKRPCKPQYRQCYRCYQFMLKKARIRREMSA